MGFLSKIFKPVSKVLDKIIPNEAKPFLPYAAAFAPMVLGPGIMGSSMLQRGLTSGALNLGAQLAQEESEGDFNPLSVLMAGGIGALSAPGAGNQIRGGNVLDEFGVDGVTGAESIKEGLMGKGQQYLGKTADFLSASPNSGGVFDIVGPGGTEVGLNMATAKALAIPLGQGAMDSAYADAMRAEKDFEDSQGGGSGYGEGNQNRGLAVRRAMERGGHEEQTIQDMLESLGYADPDPQPLASGGRVGYSLGNLVRGSGIAQPMSASMNAGDPRSTGGGSGSGIGGMVANMIGNNPQLFSTLGRSENVSIPNNDIDFIDENQNGIDDRQEKAYGGRIGFAGGGMDASKPDFGGIPRAIKNVKTSKIEDVSEIVELNDLSKLDGFAEMLATIDKSDPKYNSIRQMAISEAEMVGEKYQISPVDLVGYLDTKTDMISEKTTDDGKKEVLMESIKNTSFGFADGGVTSVLPEGMEMDYRGGGFIPMGSKERADDVPARVSKNEFVMTADAVKAAGGGSVNEGARRMYNLMNNLEART